MGGNPTSTGMECEQILQMGPISKEAAQAAVEWLKTPWEACNGLLYIFRAKGQQAFLLHVHVQNYMTTLMKLTLKN